MRGKQLNASDIHENGNAIGTAVFLLPFFSSRSIDYANKEWKSICTSNGE